MWVIITRETDYAIRILRKLQDGKLYTAGDISKTEFVPEPFAYKILNKLSRAGITEVVRGHMGGYRLRKDLKEVSMYGLLEALGVDTSVNACLKPEHDCSWKDTYGCCVVHENLNLLQREVDALLKKLTVEDFLTPQEKILG